MAIGVTLADLVHDLRAEIGHSLNPAHGLNSEESLMYLLDRVQQQLWVEFDWPMRRANRYVFFDKGDNFQPYPADMSFDGVVRVHWVDKGTGDKWTPVDYNINMVDDFGDVYDDLNERRGRPKHWDHNQRDGAIRLWPVPDADGALRLHGLVDCPRMRMTTDKCTLDGILIVMRAAAELAARQKLADAQIKMQQAQTYAQRLLAKQRSVKRKPFVIGSGYDETDPSNRMYRPGIDYIP
jgi:hypothetical protein